MKRFICLILTLLMMFLMLPAAVAQEEVLFCLDAEGGNVGDTVCVVATVENLPASASYDIIIVYDPAVLEPVDCLQGEVNGLFQPNIAFTHEGQAAVRVMGANIQGSPEESIPAVSGDATLFTVNFKILAESPGDYGTKLKTARAYFATSGFQQNAIDRIVNDRILVGDDLGDTTADAVLIMQKLIGMDVAADAAELDQNGDGTLSIADAVILLRLLNGNY